MRAIFKALTGCLLGCFALAIGSAQGTAISPLDLQSFEKVWSTIRDSHWQKNPGGLDWDAIHAEFRARVEHATSSNEARAITQEMLARLKQTHFGILPSSIYSGVQPGVEDSAITGAGTTGIDLRVLNGQAVVTSVDADSPAFQAGVRPGWIVASAGGEALAPLIQQAQSNPDIHELQLTRSLLARLSGPMVTTISATFIDGQDHSVPLNLALVRPRGLSATFGNLPTSSVWYEDKRLGATAYLRFNIFLDIPHVMPAFQRTVTTCITPDKAAANNCNGLIIDLRGNPGGIGGMAMGMAGFLVDQPNQRLGAMYMREATLNFVINPRPEVFEGPVAILLDANSASTSEIFAGGLQDLHRARIFGSHSAAAALPSVFERLPNGDGFQYAIANYISQGGKALEGIGVTPDEQVALTREGLLGGHDAVLDSAKAWIDKQKWSAGK